MAMFVHLADERDAASIRRSGIRSARFAFQQAALYAAAAQGQALDAVPRRAVFCLPVLPDFQASHQWLRELKRQGARTLVAVRFRVPDEERLFCHHYSEAPRAMTAAEATHAVMHAPDARGWEVILPRAVAPAEIHAIRRVPQLVGWRFHPGAKGTHSMWSFPGEMHRTRLNRIYEDRLDRGWAALQRTKSGAKKV